MKRFDDLQAARAAHTHGVLLVNEDGSYTVCGCVAVTQACQCRPAGYVEKLAPSYDESQPENINRRPMREEAQADLFGA